MLRDFSKLNTFITVVKEKSFSKASKKLGVSQPAVTQQIKLLESFIQAKIVDRKKNGIGLTKEGKELYKIVQKLERFLNATEKEMLQIINKKTTFILGAASVIGKFIVPNFLGNLEEAIDNNVNLKLDTSDNIIEQLLDRQVDLALVANTYNDNSLQTREWLEDELVLFSKSPLPNCVKKEDLENFKWISREDNSQIYQNIIREFEKNNIDYHNFKCVTSTNCSATIKQTILKTPIEKKPLVSFISKYAIKDELEKGELFTAKIRGVKLKRKLYIVHLKDEKNDAFIDRAVSYILKKQVA